MKKLVVILHGRSGPDRLGTKSLDAYDTSRLEQLVERLRPHIAGHTVSILTSSERAAVASAWTLALFIHSPEPVKLESLYSDSTQTQDVEVTTDIILTRGETEDVLIVVTHHGLIEELPSRVCQKSKLNRACPEQRLEPAGAILIDFVTNEVHTFK